MSAVDLLAGYREGRFSPVEATRAVLDRIHAVNDKINAFMIIDDDGALTAAKASEARWAKGAPLGLLDGVDAMSFGADQNTVHHPSVITKMHMAQAEGCSPIVTAWKEGQTHVRPVRPNSIAKSLAIGNPADGIYAIKVIEKSQGSAYAVPENEIVNGIKLLAETEGIFTETAGGVTISGLKNLADSGAIKPDDLTVVYITGNGLKTIEAVEEVVDPLSIKPSMRSFEEVFEGAK